MPSNKRFPLISRLVVRGGEAKPEFLEAGYGSHKGAPGIFGFSVQYAPGRTLDEILRVAGFTNRQVSYAELADLETAVQPLGYTVEVVPTPGRGFHHTFMVLYDVNGQILQALPHDAAVAISNALIRTPNPYFK